MNDPLVVRTTIAVLAFAAAVGHGYWSGNQGRISSWDVTLGRLGLSLLLLVAGAVQIKLYRYDVPVDGFTWATLIAVAASAVGFDAMALRDLARDRAARKQYRHDGTA